MAYITKRGNSYSVRYTYEDEHGKSCDKWESFPTKEEATNRKKQIEHSLHVADKLNEYLSGKSENSVKSSQKVVKLAI